MANELQIREQLATMRSLPLRLGKLASFISGTQWQGQPERLSLPWVLDQKDREEASRLLAPLQQMLSGSNLSETESAKAKLSLLTKMLLAMPVKGDASEATAEAKSDMYEFALDDIPPWAIDLAIRRWAKGDLPDLGMDGQNYNFAPAPAVLRRVCKLVMQPFEENATKLTRLLSCIPQERALDPTPIKIEAQKIENKPVLRLQRM